MVKPLPVVDAHIRHGTIGSWSWIQMEMARHVKPLHRLGCLTQAGKGYVLVLPKLIRIKYDEF